VRAVAATFFFPVLTSLFLPTAFFFHHRVLPSNNFLFFACVYGGFSRTFLTFVTEKCVYTCDKIALFK